MKILFLVTVVLLSGCSASLKDYESGKPELRLEEFFSGEMIAIGVIQKYSSKLTRHFCVELTGTWKKNTDDKLQGTLFERFYYDDGEIQDRTWVLIRENNPDRVIYTGTAEDVIGEAKGEVVGNVLNWKYKLDVPVKNKKGDVSNIVFNVDDWIYLLTEDRAYNRSKLKKFGISLGEVTIFFDKNVTSCQRDAS